MSKQDGYKDNYNAMFKEMNESDKISELLGSISDASLIDISFNDTNSFFNDGSPFDSDDLRRIVKINDIEGDKKGVIKRGVGLRGVLAIDSNNDLDEISVANFKNYGTLLTRINEDISVNVNDKLMEFKKDTILIYLVDSEWNFILLGYKGAQTIPKL